MNSNGTNQLNKVLLVFDFDDTIINGGTGNCVVKTFLTLEDHKNLKNSFKNNVNFVQIFKDVIQKLKDRGVKADYLKEIIEKIPLNQGFSDLFKFIAENKENYELIIISGGINIFIHWILEMNNISDIFTEVFAHKSELDEQNLINISQIHNHNCILCNTSQCKGLIVKEFLSRRKERYSNILYIGDGDNDYCPSLLLSSYDILFSRENYGLHKKIRRENLDEILKCRIIYWKNADPIKSELINLIEKTNFNYF